LVLAVVQEMQQTLTGCEVASSSLEDLMGAESITFDEGFQVCFGADIAWGLDVAAPFFAFGAIVEH
jgi:hypothetical protein